MQTIRRKLQNSPDIENDNVESYSPSISIEDDTSTLSTHNGSYRTSSRFVSVVPWLLVLLLCVGYFIEYRKRVELEFAKYNLQIDSIDTLRELDIARSIIDSQPPCPSCPVCKKTECPICRSCKICQSCPMCPICPTSPPSTQPSKDPTSKPTPSPTKYPTLLPTSETQSKAVKLLSNQNQRLIQQLQRISQSLLIQKYGKEPYHVEISLSFPSKSNQKQDLISIANDQDRSLQPDKDIQHIYDDKEVTSQRLVLEMAPGRLMPYTVLYFLSQVSAGLWDGCSFVRRASHVLQATNTGPSCSVDAFKKLPMSLGLGEGLAFQEYHSDYPHRLHTVGIAGRPGGPDFYINIVDNSDAHGPGGQGEYEAVNEADPCFARVISGLDAIEWMKRLEVTGDAYGSLTSLLKIEKARIVSTKDTTVPSVTPTVLPLLKIQTIVPTSAPTSAPTRTTRTPSLLPSPTPSTSSPPSLS